MMKKTPMFSKGEILVCILVVFLLAACSPSQPVPEVQDDGPAVVEQEPAQMEEPPAESQSQPPADDVIWMEDMVYPGAEFLLEVDGLGGPLTPWRIYVVPNAGGEQLADFYKQQLTWFVVEHEDTIDGIKYLMLAHPQPMGFMNNVEGHDELVEISQLMDGSLLGVEVTHSDIGAGLNRLGMAIDMHGIADQIPPNATIIVLEYYHNIY